MTAISTMPFAPDTRQVDNKPEALVVAEALRSAILKGELVGRDRVRQDHVATKLGVRHMIVREALKQSVAESFVPGSSGARCSLTRATLSLRTGPFQPGALGSRCPVVPMLNTRGGNVPDTGIITVCVATSRLSTLSGTQDSWTRAPTASHRRDGPMSAITRADGFVPL